MTVTGLIVLAAGMRWLSFICPDGNYLIGYASCPTQLVLPGAGRIGTRCGTAIYGSYPGTISRPQRIGRLRHLLIDPEG